MQREDTEEEVQGQKMSGLESGRGELESQLGVRLTTHITVCQLACLSLDFFIYKIKKIISPRKGCCEEVLRSHIEGA